MVVVLLARQAYPISWHSNQVGIEKTLQQGTLMCTQELVIEHINLLNGDIVKTSLC